MTITKYLFFLFQILSRYFIIAGVFFLLFYVIYKSKWSYKKIQQIFPRAKDYRREILNSLFSIGLFALIPALFFKNPDLRPYTQLYDEIVEKGWGKEIIFVNNDDYCGKLLCFEKGKKFSMHYHILKKETWYVSKGSFILIWVETQNGTTFTEYLNVGDVITNERGEPHQLIALEDAEVFEVSTKHFDDDSYRMWKGD